MSAPSPEQAAGTQLERWGSDSDNLLQMLIGVQAALGHIPEAAIRRFEAALGVGRARIEGLIGFYAFLHHRPRGRFDIRVADNIIERMRGSRELAEALAGRLGCPPGETRVDGRLSLGYTPCIGMSDQAPALLVNGYAIPAVEHARLEQVVALVEANTPLADWPPELFEVALNIQRKDLLLEAAVEDGAALAALKASGADALMQVLEASGLRGRGGAGFGLARKWGFCRQAPAEAKRRVVVCNADEGEPGTFKDRVLMQDPQQAARMFEGMTLCAGMVGADSGFLYLRGEYRNLLEPLERELQRRRDAGLLGKNIAGIAGFDFDIAIHLGAGAYICGEESALIESLEGKRGNPRDRPPFPVTRGYLGRPTVVNNVETFIAAALVAVQGADWHRARGTEHSAGTKILSVSGDCARPGIYEYPFGVTLQQILDDCGAADTQAVQIAGAAGRTIPPDEFQRRVAFEDLGTAGSFMIFDQSRDLLEMVRNFNDFFVHESCGFCTPCRVGTTLMQKTLAKVSRGHAAPMDLDTLRRIGELMRRTSHCGLGATAPLSVLDTLDKFPALYRDRLSDRGFVPGFDLDAALSEARAASGRDDPRAHLEGDGV